MALRRVTASPKVFVDPHKAQDMHYGDSSLRCAVGAVQRVGIGGAREPAFFRCTSSLQTQMVRLVRHSSSRSMGMHQCQHTSTKPYTWNLNIFQGFAENGKP